jgi:hypothetical protein
MVRRKFTITDASATGNRQLATKMKLWQKHTTSLREVEQFTVGNDRDFDLLLRTIRYNRQHRACKDAGVC